MKPSTIAQIALAASLLTIALFSQSQITFDLKPEEMSMMREWMAKHNKSYSNPEELAYRSKVVIRTIKKISSVNKSSESYKLGLNKFSDLTSEEFSAKYLSKSFQKVDAPLWKPKTAESGLSQAPIREIDWSSTYRQYPVSRTAGSGCFDSYAFSAVDSINYALAIQKRRTITYGASPQELIDCSSYFGNRGCAGGTFMNSYEYSIVKGIESMYSYPYYGSQNRCSSSSLYMNMVQQYYKIPAERDDVLYEALLTQPVTVALNFVDLQHYASGVFNLRCPWEEPFHQLLLVGYGIDPVTRQRFWKLQNHWGENYGERGFLRISAEVNNNCGISGNAYTVQMY